MPAGVPGLTDVVPVAALKVSPAGTVAPGARLMVTLAVVAAAPFSVSPAKAFSTFTPPDAPLIPPTLSLVATIGAGITVTVSVATAQLPAFSTSQMR